MDKEEISAMLRNTLSSRAMQFLCSMLGEAIHEAKKDPGSAPEDLFSCFLDLLMNINSLMLGVQSRSCRPRLKPATAENSSDIGEPDDPLRFGLAPERGAQLTEELYDLRDTADYLRLVVQINHELRDHYKSMVDTTMGGLVKETVNKLLEFVPLAKKAEEEEGVCDEQELQSRMWACLEAAEGLEEHLEHLKGVDGRVQEEASDRIAVFCQRQRKQREKQLSGRNQQKNDKTLNPEN